MNQKIIMISVLTMIFLVNVFLNKYNKFNFIKIKKQYYIEEY